MSRLRQLPVWYVRALAVMFIVQGTFGAVLKVVQDRTDDLPHNVLHVVSGGVGLALAWGANGGRRATGFALAFGAAYLGLGIAGAAAPGALPILALRAPDHIFHVTIGAVTLLAGCSPALARAGPQASA